LQEHLEGRAIKELMDKRGKKATLGKLGTEERLAPLVPLGEWVQEEALVPKAIVEIQDWQE